MTKDVQPPTDGAQAEPTPVDLDGAELIINKWTMWAAGVGLVPLPLVDFAATTGFSLKLVRDLAEHFGVPFEENAGKSIISALVGGLAAPTATMGIISLLKGLPLIGLPLAVITGPVMCGGITYAVGRVFTEHFASGGTLLTFDAEAMKASFAEQVEAGKALVRNRRKGKSADGPIPASDGSSGPPTAG